MRDPGRPKHESLPRGETVRGASCVGERVFRGGVRTRRSATWIGGVLVFARLRGRACAGRFAGGNAQVASRIHRGGHRPSPECPSDDDGRRRNAVRRQRVRGQGLCADAAAAGGQGRGGDQRDRVRVARTGGRRVPRRCAVRVGRSRILRFDDIERRLTAPPAPVVVSDRFPTDGHHGRKFIAFGPDGGSTCPWARHATSANRTPIATRTSCG